MKRMLGMLLLLPLIISCGSGKCEKNPSDPACGTTATGSTQQQQRTTPQYSPQEYDPYGGQGGYDPYGQSGGYDPYGGQGGYDPYGGYGGGYDPYGGYGGYGGGYGGQYPY